MPKIIEFTQSGKISRPLEEVRSQFADYVYHSKQDVHSGIRFTVFKQDKKESHYQQEVKILGMPQKDELISRINADGTVTTEVLKGVNQGFKIHFEFAAEGPSATQLKAHFSIPVSGFKAFIAPLFKVAAQKIAAKAFGEDKTDLESGRYEKYRKTIPS